MKIPPVPIRKERIWQNLTEALGKSWDFRFTIAKQTPLKKIGGGPPFTIVDATLPICQPFPKQKRKIRPKKRKRSFLGSTQLEVRLLREQRGKVRFAQGLRQKAQQRHQSRLWGCQTISDHVRLSKPCFPGFSQLIFSHGKRSSQGHGLIGGVSGGHVQQQWRPGVPLLLL